MPWMLLCVCVVSDTSHGVGNTNAGGMLYVLCGHGPESRLGQTFLRAKLSKQKKCGPRLEDVRDGDAVALSRVVGEAGERGCGPYRILHIDGGSGSHGWHGRLTFCTDISNLAVAISSSTGLFKTKSSFIYVAVYFFSLAFSSSFSTFTSARRLWYAN